MIIDAKGTPLAVTLTGANRHDVTQALLWLEAIAPVGGKPGRPCQRPDSVYTDRAYNSQKLREQLRARSFTPKIARRQQAHGSDLGVYRYVAKQSRIRHDCSAFIHEAFLSLACCLICFRHL